MKDISNPPQHLLSESSETTRALPSKLKRMGAGAFGLSVAVHAIFVGLAIFFFVKWNKPVPDIEPMGAGNRGGDGGASAAAKKVSAANHRATMATDHSRVISVESVSDIAMPDSSKSPTDAKLFSMPEAGGIGLGGESSGGHSGSGPGGSGDGGTGKGGHGGGFGPGFSAKLFFGQKMVDRRTVFVLDYSKSMEEQNRRDLLESELERSLNGMNDNVPYQVILFAGYAWLPGDKVDLAADQMSATVTSGDRVYEWQRPSRNNFDWIAVDGGNRHFIREVPWIDVTAAEVAKTVAKIKNYRLQMNTSWEAPLEMALSMKPAPDVIYFMTDGITADKDAKRIVERLEKKANESHTHINTISMMEPTEIEAMQDLARKTGGGFSIVHPDKTSQMIFPEKVTEH